MTSSVALASPLNDPEGRLLPYIEKYGKALHTLYKGNIAVSITHRTDTRIVHSLSKAGIYHLYQPAEFRHIISDNYKRSLSHALRYNTTHIHLLDFDRALHWVKRYP